MLLTSKNLALTILMTAQTRETVSRSDTFSLKKSAKLFKCPIAKGKKQSKKYLLIFLSKIRETCPFLLKPSFFLKKCIFFFREVLGLLVDMLFMLKKPLLKAGLVWFS